jgi:ElaB/YqjD/DUF883 family membrane-anchored ribosome-binding protein
MALPPARSGIPAAFQPPEQRKMTMDAKTKDQGNVDMDTLVDDIATLKRDFAALVEHMKNGADDAARGAAARVGEKANQLYGELGEHGRRSAEAMRQEVEERPFTSLAIAFAVGFIGGRLLSR